MIFIFILTQYIVVWTNEQSTEKFTLSDSFLTLLSLIEVIMLARKRINRN